MKLFSVLPFAALSIAFVIPDEEVMSQVAIESHQAPESIFDELPTKPQALTEFEKTFSDLIDTSKDTFDQLLEDAAETGEEVSTAAYATAFDAKAWMESAANKVEDLGKHGNHGKHGHHGHCKPNLTVRIMKKRTCA